MIDFLKRLMNVTYRVFFVGFVLAWLNEARYGLLYLTVFLSLIISLILCEFVVSRFNAGDENQPSETK